MNNQEEIYKMPVISNIQNMQRAIGVTVSSFEWLNKKTYDELHEEQCSIIEHYNQAVTNRRKQQ